MDKLASIGFYTLSDHRVKNASMYSSLWRCELIVTSRCNFNCVYCRKRTEPDLPLEDALNTLKIWTDQKLKCIRFSGGEPTVYPHLLELVRYAKEHSVEQIAISTNGSASKEYYDKLLEAGVNDFSISLDACCAATGDSIAQKENSWDIVVGNIKHISKHAYVTLGVVLMEMNLSEVEKIVQLGYDLGVSDIRLISAAQWNGPIVVNIPDHIRQKFPILNYRLKNLARGRNVRGLSSLYDNDLCPLVLDDMAVEGNKHYPCIIYMRERGAPIGEIGPNVREERYQWYAKHNPLEDPICSKNCLDVCIDYNNRMREVNWGCE